MKLIASQFRSLLGACLLPLVVFACGGKEDEATSPEPEVLGSITGKIVKDPSSTAAGPDVKVVLYWTNFAKNGDTAHLGATATPENAGAGFKLDLAQPPAIEALNDFTYEGKFPEETRVGTAVIAAVSPTAPAVIEEDKDVLGVAEHFVLAYADSDVKPNTRAAKLLNGTPAKGYHLMKVIPAAPGETFDKLVEVDTPAAAASVEVKLAPKANLEYPNYF